MKLAEFDYDLPEELIAQMPADRRENSRLMVLDRAAQTIEHKYFYDIAGLLDDTLLVLNDTKVIPARLFAKKETGAQIEIFLLKEVEPHKWQALIKPSKRVAVGMVLKVSGELSVRPLENLDDRWIVELLYNGNIYEVLQRAGTIPLPPYIKNYDNTHRYQTVYAKNQGSVAAPTAGLHFTPEILKKFDTAYITLNVGLGTFRPVKCDNILDHKMDEETFEIPVAAADAINQARVQGKKITAVGTTTVRTLESVFVRHGQIKPCTGASELFIYPGYEFKVVDRLITNFHLPKSTLLMLVSAIAGKDFAFRAYEEAIANKYRFYSYGDCMLIK